MATSRRRMTPERAKARLKLRAAIVEIKEKKMQMADREKSLRRQLRST